MTYAVAEIFTSVQGEGMWTGVPMTFIRFVGCSVGKTICHYCDTDFDKVYEWKGGGTFTKEQLRDRIVARHVCFTGGEPLNQALLPQLLGSHHHHIETSGTVFPEWMRGAEEASFGSRPFKKFPALDKESWVWITVSPKPGYMKEMLDLADELKIIVPGLGSGGGWPNIDLARRYAELKPVYLQPRNEKLTVNRGNLDLCLEYVAKYPELRLSAQLHKFLTVR